MSTALLGVGVSQAEPVRPTIQRTVDEGQGVTAVYVYSPAMRKTIKVQVITPRHPSGTRPSLYLLSGLGEEDPANSMWLRKTDARNFYADKNVNAVMPLAGNGSFYTDWQRDDPKLGRYQWETFLVKELPPLIDAAFDGNGRRGIAGISMGAGAGLVLAARNPGFYKAVGAYSGCYSTAGIAGETYPRAIVAAFGGDANNMWGPPGSSGWAAHDVLSLAHNLRGTTLYISTGTGRSGTYDQPGYPDNSDPVDRQVIGGAIETGALWCTQQLQSRLTAQHIGATIRYVDPGTHAWPYWRDQQRESWPTLERGMNS
ncbi:alpha/beta hydrolase [Gordonia sputi]|uniref:alpha/beta hydrolase n=1 Tax=Gordonia sputi TaxID=36823 RepID=UPI0035574E31